MLLRTVASPIAASLDRLVARAITGRSEASRRRSRSESLGHAERIRGLPAIADVYAPAEPRHEVDRFFGAAVAASPRLSDIGRRSSRTGPVRVADATWPSRIETFCADVGSRFAEGAENHHAHARLFLGTGTQRPAVVLVHGY